MVTVKIRIDPQEPGAGYVFINKTVGGCYS